LPGDLPPGNRFQPTAILPIVMTSFGINAADNTSGMLRFREIMEIVGTTIDAAGVLIVVLGALIASYRFLRGERGDGESPYRFFRQNIGRAILLSLEFLVAGDIIRTVVVAPTLENVVILGLIVLIRTFLSFALELEVEGRFPWQRPLAELDAMGAQHPGQR
jgi:uncharacterized membrane protein